MKKTIFFLLGIIFVLTACDKDDPVPLPQGTFTATSTTENMPVRAFVNSGEIHNTATIDRILDDYENYIPDSWEISFTGVEPGDQVIQIHDSYIESGFMTETVRYNYTVNRKLLFLEMQDTVTVTASYSDYYIQLFNALNVYPLPEFKEYDVPAPTGFYVISKYKDKRYIEIIDEHAIRMHFTRYLYVVNFTKPAYQTFWILPVELNNYFKETGYPVIKEDDAILVKEFEVEYRKNE